MKSVIINFYTLKIKIIIIIMKDLKRTKVKSTTLNLHNRINKKSLLLTHIYIVILVEKIFRKIQSYVIYS